MSLTILPQGTADPTQPAPVIIFGEVLFDCFPDGRRILGGAPFNVAWGLQGFGHDPMMVTAVGDDAEGREIRRRMEAWGMSTRALQTDPDHPTGDVVVTLKAGEPSYEICRPRAWDHISDGGQAATRLLYHGSLALRCPESRRTFAAIRDRSTGQRFFDVNLRPPHDALDAVTPLVRGVDWLKLNIHELAAIQGEAPPTLSAAVPAIDHLRAAFSVRNVLLTAGGQGAMMHGDDGHAVCTPAPAPERIVDTVGAGDAFAAYAIHGILGGQAPGTIIEEASRFAARVCGMRGATTTDRNLYHRDHHHV